MYRSGAHTVYPIGYIKCVPNRVPSLDLLSAEPMSYKARLGARFVYPIGYYMYVPDQVHNSLYPPSFQGLLEFCDLVPFLVKTERGRSRHSIQTDHPLPKTNFLKDLIALTWQVWVGIGFFLLCQKNKQNKGNQSQHGKLMVL